MLFSSKPQITFTEVPNEISLTFLISGCLLNCKGCHSTHAKDSRYGFELSPDVLRRHITRHTPFITSVCFLGGDNLNNNLCELLDVCKEYQLKTCLYTGYMTVSKHIEARLDFLKVGPYVERRGGLSSPTTNQKFYQLPEYNDLTHLFFKGEQR